MLWALSSISCVFVVFSAALRLDGHGVDSACANIMFPAGRQVRDAVHCCKVSRQYCTRPGLLEREDTASRSELEMAGFISDDCDREAATILTEVLLLGYE